MADTGDSEGTDPGLGSPARHTHRGVGFLLRPAEPHDDVVLTDDDIALLEGEGWTLGQLAPASATSRTSEMPAHRRPLTFREPWPPPRRDRCATGFCLEGADGSVNGVGGILTGPSRVGRLYAWSNGAARADGTAAAAHLAVLAYAFFHLELTEVRGLVVDSDQFSATLCGLSGAAEGGPDGCTTGEGRRLAATWYRFPGPPDEPGRRAWPPPCPPTRSRLGR